MSSNREDYHSLIRLYTIQGWLYNRSHAVKSLMDFCETKELKQMVFSLLERFVNISHQNLSLYLNEIARHIILESNFDEQRVQLLALSWDDEADSGQQILQMIKHPIFTHGWRNVITVNNFHKSKRYFRQGKDQIIVIDEFIGSGKTIRSRMNWLNQNIDGEFTIKWCFIAGMKVSIDALLLEGFDIFCPLQLDKGVSGFFVGEELKKAEDLMLDLELKLAQTINQKQLYDYSFGYGGAEALYSMEEANGNTPNSTFPIFWWLKDKNNESRQTILTRVERGFHDED